MAITIHSIDLDKVINSQFSTGCTDYEFALKNLYPLIDRLTIQRKIQNAKFYERLERDLIKGCIMPPITIAFINDEFEKFDTITKVTSYVNDNVSEAFILDGIQRLNILKKTFDHTNNLFKENEDSIVLDLSRPLFVNVLICSSMDNLLYRMITLNNGQKPMTARHQIEILADNIYDFSSADLEIQTEKEKDKKRIRGSFNKADFIKAYLAYLSESIGIDNKKIIESKLDELLANRILDSDITEDELEFSEIIELIEKLSEDESVRKWFKVTNNLIGFSVGIKSSFNFMKSINIASFKSSLNNFENAFDAYDVSKIKLGTQRRKAVKYFIANYEKFFDADSNDILMDLTEID